ncbi:hypothetical protein BU15DRAFT_68015 [Melanogaster broomeanus]|nr:hypothetical protein BU15DRAFT_68015 [Melanogaster broomeanus]
MNFQDVWKSVFWVFWKSVTGWDAQIFWDTQGWFGFPIDFGRPMGVSGVLFWDFQKIPQKLQNYKIQQAAMLLGVPTEELGLGISKEKFGMLTVAIGIPRVGVWMPQWRSWNIQGEVWDVHMVNVGCPQEQLEYPGWEFGMFQWRFGMPI